MYFIKDLGKLRIEYVLDEKLGGRHPYCASCQTLLLPEDERIVLRKEKPNSQGIREGIYFCGKCALELTQIVRRLLKDLEDY